MEVLYIVCFFIIGLVFGSFFCCVGLRLSVNTSFIKGRSYCDNCHHELKWLELIPLFSYIFLKGKCRYCHKKISFLNFFIELVTGILFALSYYSFGFSYELLIALGVISLLIIITVSDLNYLIIPDEVLVFFSFYFLIVQFLSSGFLGAVHHLFTGIFLFLLMYVIMWCGEKLLKKESLGGGDVKMMFLFGLVLDPLLGTIAIFLGSVFALPMSLFLLYKNHEKVIPFGPFLLIALTFLYFTKITPSVIISWLQIP